MDSDSRWFVPILNSLSDALDGAGVHLPSVIAAAFILVAGWFIARTFRLVVRRVLDRLNGILERLLRGRALSLARLSRSAIAVLSEVTFWVVFLFSFVLAAQVAGLEAVSGWLNQVVTHLPNFLVGAAIIFAGYIVSIFIGEQVTATASAAKARHDALIGALARGAVFVTALIVGLDQIGINVTFLIALFAVVIGAISMGFSIAFGLGARVHVQNLIAARNARKGLKVGQHIKVGEFEGTLIELTATHLVLEITNGKVFVPGLLAEEKGVIVQDGSAISG